MANDIRVVVPSDIGNTIKLGAKEVNKYDVDVSALELPEQVTDVTLQGTTLTVKTVGGDKAVDLSPMLPQVVLDTVLKKVEKQDNKIVFTVGNKDNEDANTTLEVDVADLLPVVADEESITGTGVDASKLAVKLAAGEDNLITKSAEGIAVSKAAIQSLLPEEVVIPARDVRLVNASGTTVVGYIHSTEQ